MKTNTQRQTAQVLYKDNIRQKEGILTRTSDQQDVESYDQIHDYELRQLNETIESRAIENLGKVIGTRQVERKQLAEFRKEAEEKNKAVL